jgi:hypothetical protein
VQRYMKFIVAAVGAAVYAAQAAISDGHITGTEGYGILTAAAIAVFVYLVPNKPAVEQPTERVERPY